jgi:hypothetical protein
MLCLHWSLVHQALHVPPEKESTGVKSGSDETCISCFHNNTQQRVSSWLTVFPYFMEPGYLRQYRDVVRAARPGFDSR